MCSETCIFWSTSRELLHFLLLLFTTCTPKTKNALRKSLTLLLFPETSAPKAKGLFEKITESFGFLNRSTTETLQKVREIFVVPKVINPGKTFETLKISAIFGFF